MSRRERSLSMSGIIKQDDKSFELIYTEFPCIICSDTKKEEDAKNYSIVKNYSVVVDKPTQ